MDIYIKEKLTTSAQYIIGEKQNERNEDWYDQDCREIMQIKREARLKCLQCNMRAHQADYTRKGIAERRERQYKEKLMKLWNITLRMKVRNITKKSKT
jgi:hypothetical protein